MTGLFRRALFGGRERKAGDRPNVLLVSLDTLRFDCVGAVAEHRFLGDLAAQVATPHLNALARAGAVFTNAVSAAPFTTPSHASLFTGLWLPQHGAHHQYKTPIAASARTLAERLVGAGYRTAQSAGRAQGEGVMFASDSTGLKRGYQTSIYAGSVDRATRKWLQKAKGRPWHLFFHTFAAHWPYGRTSEECEAMFAAAWESDDWSAVRRMYVDNARSADEIVGELVACLAEVGELDRTLIVLLADHGEGLHHLAPLHGPINGGREEVIRVPLVIVAPWVVAPGTRVDEQVRTVDLLPTILDVVGIGPEPDMLPLAGESLLPVLRGEAPVGERYAFFAGHLNDDPSDSPLLAGVRTGAWKFIIDECTEEKVELFDRRLAKQGQAALKADLRGRLLHEMFERSEPIKLFDLLADPLETRNVVADHPELVETLRSQVERWRASSSQSSDDGGDDAELEEQLRALGYLT